MTCGIAASGNHRPHRPGDNPASRIEAVFIVHPSNACKVNRANSQRGTPLIRIVGVRIAGRCFQIVEISWVRRFRRRINSNGIFSGFCRTICTGHRQLDRALAGLDTIDLAFFIHSQDILVQRLPAHRCIVRILGIQHSGQIDFCKGCHLLDAFDSNGFQRNRLGNRNRKGCSLPCGLIFQGNDCLTDSYAGDHAICIHSQDIRVFAAPFRIHRRAFRSRHSVECQGAAYTHGVFTVDPQALQGRTSEDCNSAFLIFFIMVITVITFIVLTVFMFNRRCSRAPTGDSGGITASTDCSDRSFLRFPFVSIGAVWTHVRSAC